MSQSPQQDKPSIALPVAALVFAFFCFPVGVILAIVAMAKNNSKRGSEARTLSIVALCVNIAFVPVVAGILAAVAIPGLIQYQCKSKQGEARANLKSLVIAEESYRAEHETYSPDQAAIGFQPFGGTLRYTYVINAADKQTFSATASGTGDMLGDVWVVDQSGTPHATLDRCH